MSSTDSAPSVAVTARKLVRRKSQAQEILENCLGLVAVLVLLIAVFGLSTAHFFSITTFTSIANEIPTSALIAVGMTFVLIIAGIDLSVGSVLAVSGGVLSRDGAVASASTGCNDRLRPGRCVLWLDQWRTHRPVSITVIHRHAWFAGSGPRRSLLGYQFANAVYQRRALSPALAERSTSLCNE
jgi:hypothetical protein